MEITFLQVLVAVFSFVILAVPAFIMTKTKLIGVAAGEVVSMFVLYCCSPAQILMSFQNISYNEQIGINILIVAGLALIMYVISTFVMLAIVRGKRDIEKKKVMRLNGIISNCGYMGIPFLQLLFPTLPEVVVYAAVIISVQNIYMWTVGVYVLTGSKKEVSIKKVFLNPCIITLAIGALSFFLIKKPFVDLVTAGTLGSDVVVAIMKGVEFFGNMVTPLAMSVIGIKIANVNIKKILFNKLAYVTSAHRLVLASIISILLVAFLPLPLTIKYSIFFAFSMPSATAVTMLSIRFKGDGDFASVAVLLSTMLSVITLPLMFLLFTVFV